MAISRIARVQERKERQRLTYAVLGIVALIAFLAIFGLKILVGFSLLVDRIRGGSPAPQAQNQNILVAPTLNPTPEFTNTNEFTISGSGQPTTTVILFVDGKEAKKATIDSSGTFSFPVTLAEGSHTVSAKIIDDLGNASDLSAVLSVVVKKEPPALEVTQPNDGDSISGDQNTVLVAGRVEEGARVTVNGRLVIINSDGSFKITITLSEGENTISTLATDEAGNQTLLERKVTYQR